MTMEEHKRMHELEDLLQQVLYWFKHGEIDCNDNSLRLDLIDLMERVERCLK